MKRIRVEERLDRIDTVLNDCGGSTDSIPDTLQSPTPDVIETEVMYVADDDGLQIKYRALKQKHKLLKKEHKKCFSDISLRLCGTFSWIGFETRPEKSTSLPNHIPLPSVDSNKRDAVIEYTLKQFGFEVFEGSSKKRNQKRKAAKTAIIKSLSDYVREENSKAKKL
ncbi:unnamed protein product [Allacma fusca]|uniref:Uncharacterized protein n=1 Tax=Allacma fusca TaxID=39272 RepID=A0A8J2JVB2_9HEXA|nr:unnamed protein product [Allacma fusca]